jgi:ATP-dependent RNA helicase DDX3X
MITFFSRNLCNDLTNINSIFTIQPSKKMDSWGTGDLAQALPSVESAKDGTASSTVVAAPASTRNPQDAGWAAPEAYDYATYNRTTKELHDESTVGGATKDWASNSARYEWNDEYGDVGPAIPELERQLFGSEEHVRTGIQFDK